MTYKELFVHLDSTERSDERARIAFDVARRFGANVRGLYGECDPYLANLASLNVEEMYAASVARHEERFKELAAEFEVSAQWETSVSRRDSALTKAVTFGARHSDLVVLGQHNPDQKGSGVPPELTEQVVLVTGRPVLVVPFSGDVKALGKRIIVGWNAGREAVRAVHDALPFLQSAEEVIVFSVNPWEEDKSHGDLPGADLAKHLAAHGVKAKTETLVIEGKSPMEALLSHGAERSIDLFVVGAHGQYGFPNFLRGSGTKHLLHHMTVPVLMSH